MELIPIEDLERWPVKVIAFCFISPISLQIVGTHFNLIKYFHAKYLAQVLLVSSSELLTKRRIKSGIH